jgi:hypothetical protein
MIKAVKANNAVGSALNLEDVKSYVFKDIIQYEEQVITPFDDLQLSTITTVDSFINDPSIIAQATRPLGSATHPRSRGKGFAEGIIARSADAFNAVIDHCSMKEISDVYNDVSNFTNVNGYEVSGSFNIGHAISNALHDLSRNTLRVTDAPINSMMASEVVSNSHFLTLGADFYAFVVEEDTFPIRLASGVSSVDMTLKNMGNIHGSFAYGRVAPTFSTSMSSAYDDSVCNILEYAVELLVKGYFPRQVNVTQGTTPDVSFEEQNDTYDKRISKIDSTFVRDWDVDKDLLQVMACSPFMSEAVRDIVDRDLILFVHGAKASLRYDASAYLALCVGRHLDKLVSTYSKEALAMFRAMLVRPLTVTERIQVKNPEFMASTKAIAADVVSVLKGRSKTLRAYYIMAMVDGLQALETDKPIDMNSDENLSPIFTGVKNDGSDSE